MYFFYKVVHKPQEKKNIAALKNRRASKRVIFFQNTHTERESKKDIHVFFLRDQSATFGIYVHKHKIYPNFILLSRKSVY